jgi:predicted CoA-binding protein
MEMTTADHASTILGLLVQPETSVAVVGATDDPSKYGGRIYRDLKGKGFTVYAVNPGRETVDGDPCWASLEDLPAPPTIVDFVVPPEVTLQVLEDALRLGYTAAWLQPGAEDAAVVDYLEANGFTYLVDACIMVEALPRR